nr:uncharacterized protein LOC105847560 isoform X1 [Hydra vulgaris]
MLLNTVYQYSIFLNDVSVYTENNNSSQKFINVSVYAGDPWRPTDGYLRNLFIFNSISVPKSYQSESLCNTSSGYGFNTRNVYSNGTCYEETKECYMYTEPLWKVNSSIFMLGYETTLNLQIYPTFLKASAVNLEFEYFLPIFFTISSENYIQGFSKTQTNRMKYSFSGVFKSWDSFNYTFTAVFNHTLCPISGMVTLEIPFVFSYRVEAEKPGKITKTFQKQVECFNYPKTSFASDLQFFAESYARELCWDPVNSYIYLCMNQYYPSTKVACWFSKDNGNLWAAVDIRVGSVLGRHSVTRELYAIHRNRKTYLMFHNYFHKWLVITTQQFMEVAFSYLDLSLHKSLEGDFDQIYTFGTNQWLGNSKGLFFRNLENDTWILRVRWPESLTTKSSTSLYGFR